MDTENHCDRGILILAYGSSSYLRAAKVLRQCLKIHSPNIPCALATDQYKKQRLKRHFDTIIPIKIKRESYTNKAYINELSPFKRTLYIDSNSLVLKDISHVFDLFKGQPFTHSAGNVRSINDPLMTRYKNKNAVYRSMKHYQVEHIRCFNGGVYYFEKCLKADLFFNKAQEIITHVADDEIAFAITNELTQIPVVYFKKEIMRNFVGVTKEKICVLSGKSSILKKGQWENPAIFCLSSGVFRSFHFLHFVYMREKLKLKLNNYKNLGNEILNYFRCRG